MNPKNEAAAQLHLFRSLAGTHLLVVDGSRIYDIETDVAQRLEGKLTSGASMDVLSGDDLWRATGLFSEKSLPKYINGQPLTPPSLYSISLNVAQICNMSCGYCYADSGRFGGRARTMDFDVAKATVDRLIAEAAPGADLLLGYMGGEPLLNRKVVHWITKYAHDAALKSGRRIRFSITTNLTVLRPEDAELMSDFPFTVAVSIDGTPAQNDAVRRMNDGKSSYQQLLKGLELFKRHGRPQHLSARVTVTPRTGRLLPVLDHILALGFDEVGFGAVLVSPDQALAFHQRTFLCF
jgi:uncharacterized protein